MHSKDPKAEPPTDGIATRRNFARVRLLRGVSVEVKSGPMQGAFSAVDVSVYGLSFLAPDTVAGALGAGEVLRPLSFQLNGRRIQVGTVVRHVSRVRGPGGKLQAFVGVEFTEISPEDVWFLSDFVVSKGAGNPIYLPAYTLKSAIRKRTAKKRKPKPTASKRKPKRAAKAVVRKPKGARARVRKTRRKSKKKR